MGRTSATRAGNHPFSSLLQKGGRGPTAGTTAARPRRGSVLVRFSAPVSEISQQIADARKQMEADEKTKLMMQALRGANINDDAFSSSTLDMKLVEMRASSGADDILPLTYQPEQLKRYFGRRPGAVIQRVLQVATTSFGLLASVAIDSALGRKEDMEVRRAAQLRDTITSLGPFFIKLGQALSIRPDILSPKAMVELQQLCDKVPSYPSEIAFDIIRSELGIADVSEVYGEITPEPVAAASLGQVYKARLRDGIPGGGSEVAVKVQRPFVLETVSLDLHLARELGLAVRTFGGPLADRLDIVDLLDEFAGRFYSELDYVLECANGLKIEEDMKAFPNVVIPTNYPAYTARRVHTAEWIDGEKLSQSRATDVGSLVNLGVLAYLTQLLETGFFHADPHPGNMLRTPQGELVILDFGLMTEVTDNQKYGMIEAIAHLINRDYDEIGQDFVNLDFIPEGTDTTPIVPALKRVFDAALAGGGAKSINFQELAADLAEITFEYPFRIPPYFALVIRAIGVLEGIALVGNPNFAIVDEAYPYIARRLLTDKNPRMRAALRYMVYGKSGTFDAERLIDLLQGLEKFVAVKDKGDGSAFKVDGVRGSVNLGTAGDFEGTKTVDLSKAVQGTGALAVSGAPPPALAVSAAASAPAAASAAQTAAQTADSARDALRFLFSEDGDFFREFILDELVNGVDALSRDAARTLALSVGLRGALVPAPLRALAPKLTPVDQKVVENIQRLLNFFLGASGSGAGSPAATFGGVRDLFSGGAGFDGAAGRSGFAAQLFAASRSGGGGSAGATEARRQAAALAPVLAEYAPAMQRFGTQIVGRLTEKLAARLVRYTATEVFGARPNPGEGAIQTQTDGRMKANF